MEREIHQIKISVRNLVEFIMRGGDIDNRRGAVSDKDAMQAGSRIHRKIQKRMGSGYKAEVSLKRSFDCGFYEILVEGRADGIFTEEEAVVIDEIKGVYMELGFLKEPVPVHKAQAMCYGYFYGMDMGLTSIGIQMTYVNIETEDIKRFREEYTLLFLEQWFSQVLKEYVKWADYQVREREKRQKSIESLEFPFPYREGQRQLAVSVYRTIERKKTLFIQAPTGTGKTISAVFPAVKAVGEGLAEKIFYLTAKTITRTVAEEAFEVLRGRGLSFKTVTITAKEKLCICEEKECNPVACPYAKGHYDRVNDAVYDLICQEDFAERELIKAYAKKHQVCPFEMCLDVSNWVDGIICDYNYVFDPNVKLKRYFAEGVKGSYIFLIDEAHNLVERAREMYSACLYKEDFLDMKRLLKDTSKRLTTDLEQCNKILLGLKRECDGYMLLPGGGPLILKLQKLMGDMEVFMDEHRSFEHGKKLSEFYLAVRHFLNIHDLLDESYRIYTEFTGEGRFLIKLFCVHTAHNLRQCLDKGASSIFFSATLLPIRYYKDLLSQNSEDYAIYVDSPFESYKRLLLMGTDVSSKYTRRNQSEYLKIVKYIDSLLKARTGNYMVFFPSYRLMQEVYELAMEKGLAQKAKVYIQTSNMTESDKEDFLNAFEKQPGNEKALVAFCVLGGIFSEGIDLKEERLIGTVIVGTGLPQVCTEREILKDYYDQAGQEGFDYAYRFPGMNKVLQAAGRVIRTKEDEGVILLLDHRFQESRYQMLFPREWQDIKRVNIVSAERLLHSFWQGRKQTDETDGGLYGYQL